MIKIKIVGVGKIKESYLKDGINEYKKRLSRFAKIEIIEVMDCKIPEKPSEKEILAVLEKEAENILPHIKNNSIVFSLCIEGESLSSVEFSNIIEKTMSKGASELIFIIGGSVGLSEKIKALSNYRLSFSKMTFLHMQMRLILLEQIYRAFKIISNESYHK